MTDTITISGSVIAALIVCGLLCIIIPAAAVVIFKLKNREVSLLSALWGAVGFVVFALILEQLLHMVMLPIVQKNIWIYAIYGAFAAGIFEETARFLVFKTVMRKKTSPKDGVMYGIGHGGVESALVVGIALINLAVVGILVNAVGVDEALTLTGATNGTIVATAQIAGLTQQSVGMCFVSVFERILTMVLHVALSVWVFRAAKEKGKVWLYPAAILMHAAVDFPAVLFQGGLLPLWAVYVILAVLDAIAVFIAVWCYKSLNKQIKS